MKGVSNKNEEPQETWKQRRKTVSNKNRNRERRETHKIKMGSNQSMKQEYWEIPITRGNKSNIVKLMRFWDLCVACAPFCTWKLATCFGHLCGRPSMRAPARLHPPFDLLLIFRLVQWELKNLQIYKWINMRNNQHWNWQRNAWFCPNNEVPRAKNLDILRQ